MNIICLKFFFIVSLCYMYIVEKHYKEKIHSKVSKENIIHMELIRFSHNECATVCQQRNFHQVYTHNRDGKENISTVIFISENWQLQSPNIWAQRILTNCTFSGIKSQIFLSLCVPSCVSGITKKTKTEKSVIWVCVL